LEVGEELLVVVNRRGLWQICVRVYKLQLRGGGSQLSHTKTVVDEFIFFIF